MRAGEVDLSDLRFPIAVRPSCVLSDDELMVFSTRNEAYRVELSKDGELRMTPVGGTGGTHEAYVGSRLVVWAEDDGRGQAFLADTGFRMPDGAVLSPDAAWLALPRWNSLTPEQQAAYPRLCPDFLIEIRSRTDSRKVLETKMSDWIGYGCQLAWMIDPYAGEVLIYQADGSVETLTQPASVAATAPVDGFVLPLTKLWNMAANEPKIDTPPV